MKRQALLRFFRILVVTMSVSMAAAQSPGSNAELNLGVQAYKQSKYEEAIEHFEKSVALDSSNVHARLYLATAYAQQYIPGADTPDNNEMAQRAIEQYKQVVDLDLSRGATLSAVKGIAYLGLQMKQFDESKDYYRKATELDPDDPEPYYAIGVIDWTQTYQPRQEERAKLDMRPDSPLPDKDAVACRALREKSWAKIQEGIDSLSHALQLRPDYDDAMAYMNLMYRERADVQCDDPVAREADLKAADDWVDKTIAKKAKAEKPRPREH